MRVKKTYERNVKPRSFSLAKPVHQGLVDHPEINWSSVVNAYLVKYLARLDADADTVSY